MKVRLFLFCVLFAVATSGAALAGERCLAVYYDEDYPLAWIGANASAELRDFASALGFETKNAGETAAWMTEKTASGATGCLLFMARDVVPEQLVGKDPAADALIRRYLDAGGSVLWLGDVPFYFVGKSGREKVKWDYLGGRGVLGFDTVGNWQVNDNAKPSDTGAEWGLASTWQSARALPAATIDVVLARDPGGAASGWAKSFKSGAPGFIRYWDASLNSFTDTLGEDIYRIVDKMAPGALAGGRLADIYLFKESDYLPLVHRRADGLTREVLITFFQPGGGDMKVFLDVAAGGKTLESIPLLDGGKIYFRKAVEAPLLAPDQTLAVRVDTGGVSEIAAEKRLAERDAWCEFKWEALPRVNPVDMGILLPPADMLPLAPGSTAKVTLGVWPLGGGERNLLYSVTGHAGDSTEALIDGVAVFKPNALGQLTIDLPGLTRKLDSVSLTVREGEKTICEDSRKLLFRDKTETKRGFGAWWAELEYPAKAPVYDRDKKKWSGESWNKLWERGPKKDVVVNFDDGRKFVFWRGSGYVPFWASDFNVGMTYEWLEAAWGRGGLVDCIEVLQDKECRYSRVEIVSSTSARAVVRWRYALADLEYTIADGEWGDETYVFYPDGWGVRHASGWFVPMTWHEANEFIVNIPAAINPFDILPEKPVKLMSLDGAMTEVAYPQPAGTWPKGTPTVFRVTQHKDDPRTPVMATRGFDHIIVQYDGWREDGRYISPSYWGVHFPVTRGYPTTVTPPPMWRRSPGHASLMAIESEPVERKQVSKDKERVRWVWLIGNTENTDEQVLGGARNWLEPVPAEVVRGAKSVEYNPETRAYRVTGAEGGTVEIKLKGKGGEIDGAAIELEGFNAESVEVAVNGKKADFRYGLESTYEADTGVVWLPGLTNDDAEIEIRGAEEK